MPLKLVPSGACEGASFLALSDHEVTATPHAGTTFTYFRHSLDRCHQEPSVPRRDWLRRGHGMQKGCLTNPAPNSNCPPRMHERRAGAGPREIAQ